MCKKNPKKNPTCSSNNLNSSFSLWLDALSHHSSPSTTVGVCARMLSFSPDVVFASLCVHVIVPGVLCCVHFREKLFVATPKLNIHPFKLGPHQHIVKTHLKINFYYLAFKPVFCSWWFFFLTWYYDVLSSNKNNWIYPQGANTILIHINLLSVQHFDQRLLLLNEPMNKYIYFTRLLAAGTMLVRFSVIRFLTWWLRPVEFCI